MSDQKTTDAVQEEAVVQESVVSLFEGMDLTEETKQKLDVLFEAAVSEKATTLLEAAKAELVEQYDTILEEAKQSIAEEYEQKIDEYLTYVAQEWMDENRLAVESGIRSEITESFIEDLRTVFESHNVMIPESKVDLYEEMKGQLEEMERSLNESIQKNIRLNRFAAELQKEMILREMTSDMSEAQAERLMSIAEDVEFSDIEQFSEKVQILKEAVSRRTGSKPAENVQLIEEEVVLEEKTQAPAPTSSKISDIEAVTSILSRMGKK